MHTDPEALAARYVAGEMRADQRWRFQRHLLDCDECWHEVAAARAGRAAIETLRRAAPAVLRDRVRATVELGDNPAGARRSWLWRFTTPVLAAVAIVVAAVLSSFAIFDDGGDGNQLAGVVTAYRDSGAWAESSANPPAARIAGLRLTDVRTGDVAGAPAVGYTYSDGNGTTVLVVRNGGSFPKPSDAQPVRNGDWVADVDRLTIFCTATDVPLLVAGADPDDVYAAASALTEMQ